MKMPMGVVLKFAACLAAALAISVAFSPSALAQVSFDNCGDISGAEFARILEEYSFPFERIFELTETRDFSDYRAFCRYPVQPAEYGMLESLFAKRGRQGYISLQIWRFRSPQDRDAAVAQWIANILSATGCLSVAQCEGQPPEYFVPELNNILFAIGHRLDTSSIDGGKVAP